MTTIERKVFVSWLKAYMGEYGEPGSALEAGEGWALDWLRTGVCPNVLDVFCDDPRDSFSRGVADALDYWRVTPDAER